MIGKFLVIQLMTFVLMSSCVLSDPVNASESIKVGLTASLSGKYKEAGMQQLQGVQMWRDDINERGSLLGRRIDLVVKDDQSRSGNIERLYERLIVDDKVDLLLGPYSSDLTVGAANVADKYQFPLLAIAASASSIWSDRGDSYVFGTYVQSDQLMSGAIELAVEKKLKSVAIIYADSLYTASIAQGARRVAADHKLEILAYELFDDQKDSLRASVEKIARTKAELIIVGAYLDDSITVVQQLKRQKVKPNMLVFSGSIDTEEFKEVLGRDVEGIMSTVQWSRSQHLPGAYDFSFRYRQKYGELPSYQSAGGYAAGQVLEAAVRLSQSLSRKVLQQQLLLLKFRSLFGHYRVDGAGRQIGKKAYLMQWQDGHRQLVMPRELSKHAIR